MSSIIRTLRVLPGLLILTLVSATSAQATKVIAPPGNSGVSQYYEVVPSAEGGVAPGAHSQNHGPVLTSSTERRLKELGAEGKAVAAFAQATGTPTRSSGKHDHGGAPYGAGAGKNSGGGSAPSIVKTAAVSSGSLGWGLPLALGLAAIFAVVLLLLRRRSIRSRTSDSD